MGDNVIDLDINLAFEDERNESDLEESGDETQVEIVSSTCGILDRSNRYVPNFIRWICGFGNCNRLCDAGSNLVAHFFMDHSGDIARIFRCRHCAYEVRTEEYRLPFAAIRKHLMLHSEVIFQCIYCLSFESTVLDITRHYSKCHKDDDITYIEYIRAEDTRTNYVHHKVTPKCKECNIPFENLKNARQHIHDCHELQNNIIIGEIKTVRFQEKGEIDSLSGLYELTYAYQAYCKQCGQHVNSTAAAERHIEVHRNRENGNENENRIQVPFAQFVVKFTWIENADADDDQF